MGGVHCSCCSSTWHAKKGEEGAISKQFLLLRPISPSHPSSFPLTNHPSPSTNPVCVCLSGKGSLGNCVCVLRSTRRGGEIEGRRRKDGWGGGYFRHSWQLSLASSSFSPLFISSLSSPQTSFTASIMKHAFC